MPRPPRPPRPMTPAWPARSAPRLFVAPALALGQPVRIEGPQAHYLSRVMRVGPGDGVILCDDRTGEWAARVIEVDKRACVLEPVGHLRPREQAPDFWLCPALLKKDRFDLVLEKAAELGAARIVPVIARRSVADKLNPERARAILTEAAEQCARTALPEMAEPIRLEALMRHWPQDRLLFFADEAGGAPAAEAFAFTRAPLRAGGAGKAALLIGPEGGFADEERAALLGLPRARAISLGPRILRAETAAIAGMGLWMALAGDWD